VTGHAVATVLAGAWRFTLVAIAGFAPWVVAGGWCHRTVGEIGLYLVCLAMFLLAALALLPGLLPDERRLQRTAVWFVPAFTAYAVLWCLCWFTFGGRAGEWAGAVAGGAVFVALSAWTLGPPRAPFITAAVFIVAHAIGYFTGDWAHRALAAADHSTVPGMFAWAVCYGLGSGAGMGWLVHACHRDLQG
jgi:hypothetical protein